MIYSNIMSKDDFSFYPAAIQRVLAFLAEVDLIALAPGKYPLDGERMFAVVSDLTTREIHTIPTEIHKNYIDVQYWRDNREMFGVAPLRGRENIVERHEEQDTWYLETPKDEQYLQAEPGTFAVFFPWDIHRLGGLIDTFQMIRKCVVKVSMSLPGEAP